MHSALYTGTVAHRRHIPRAHFFSYPFFMYFFNLAELERPLHCGRWFSTSRWALSRFHRADYYGDAKESLCQAVARRMEEITGHPVAGDVYGLLNMRTLGLYFSPVNFYYGFDHRGRLSHFLAEVSNTPWNERHQYGHFFGDADLSFSHSKEFKVSPFNPVEQHYTWRLSAPTEKLNITIEVADDRGHVFDATLNFTKRPLNRKILRNHLLRIPMMTAYILSRIYWQALKIYLKKIPYIPYRRQTT